jgi:hypothetical protein
MQSERRVRAAIAALEDLRSWDFGSVAVSERVALVREIKAWNLTIASLGVAAPKLANQHGERQ